MPGAGASCSTLVPNGAACTATGAMRASSPATANPRTRIFRSPPAHLGSNAQPITKQRRPRVPCGWVCCVRQIRSLPKRVPRSGFTSWARLHHFPPYNSFDLNLAFALACLREIVGHLQPQPGFCATAERLVEADRHLRRNTGLTVYEVVERLPRHAQNVRCFGNRQIEGFDTVVPDRKPRMRRVFHRHV